MSPSKNSAAKKLLSKSIKKSKKTAQPKLALAKKPNPKKAALVSVIMGSDSDLKVMMGAKEMLENFKVPYEIKVVSAHRTPELMAEYSRSAYDRGLKVIIAGAGGAAHLPGMVAAQTCLPVIGVPVNITPMEGWDALLSVMQMPKGVPVATVAIDNSANAALLALKILALSDDKLMRKMIDFAASQKNKVVKANKNLSKLKL
jgi:phosphoribosylaminoimidazole carboxylase PurE protein